jgi:hypothetical protein
MIQHIIVFFIVGLAAGFLIRNLYRKIMGRDICGCGCTGCADASACEGHGRLEISQSRNDGEAK